MLAVSRILRPTAIGGLLSLLFGITLIVGGLSSRDNGVGAQQAIDYCGSPVVLGVTAATCPLGTITITKETVGDAPLPPDGFTVTITSENCVLFETDDDEITFTVEPGESESSGELYQYAGAAGSDDTEPCLYTVTETAAPGWTASYSPAGAFALPQANSLTNVVVTITNTGTIAPTPSPSTDVPTTSVPESSVVPAPTTSAPALAATGSANTTPQIAIGGGLCILGIALIAGTRPKRSHA